MLKTIYNGLCDLLFPRNCLLCAQHLRTTDRTTVLCPQCTEKIEDNRPPFCQRCARHIDHISTHRLCSECRENSYAFDHAWAGVYYNDTVKTLIHLFKYKNKTSLHTTFSHILCTYIETYSKPMGCFDYIVPVALHPTRLRERGYNQSQLLAEDIAHTYNIPCISDMLMRTRHTRNQALLGKKERWTNINGAFKIRASLPLKDTSILLIDDLFTTGATASEASRTLKAAGAQHVTVLTLAIA